MEMTLKCTGEGEIYPVCTGQWKLWLEYIFMYLNVCTMGWNSNTVKIKALVTKGLKYGDIWNQGKGSVVETVVKGHVPGKLSFWGLYLFTDGKTSD